MIFSAVVGQDFEPNPRGRLFAGDLRFGHGESLRILNVAEEFGFSRLSETRRETGCKRGENREGVVSVHCLVRIPVYRVHDNPAGDRSLCWWYSPHSCKIATCQTSAFVPARKES